MRKWKESITRTYSVLVALLILVSLTGFIDKGKTVTVVEDGKSREIYTRSLNKEALTRELGITPASKDEVYLSTPKLTDGTVATVRRAVPVTLDYKGQTVTVSSGKKTVGEVAAQYGYDRENYRPYGNPEAPVEKDMTVRIGNLSRKTVSEDDVVQYVIESIPDESIGQGREEIVQEGVNGRKRVTNNIVSLDGQVVGKEHIKTELISEMKPLIRKIGTKETVEINTDDISKYKKVLTMVATAYLPTDGDGRGITYTGTRARYGEIAVDPRVIPLGTKVFIPGYGIAVAEDTGGDILGNRIDLCMESYDSCMAFGRRTVQVYILE